MAIGMRVNNHTDSCCCECKKEWKNVSEMYDLKINNNVFTICRKCSEVLFQKLLKASCMYSGKVKSQQDMVRISRERRDEIEWEEAEKGFEHKSVSKALKGINIKEN